MKKLVRLLLRLLYRFETENERVLETPGPVLLIPNHVSWLDWLFLGACLDEDWKFVTSSVTAQASWLHRKIMINRRTFPIDTNSPYAVKRMAEHLEGGGRLVLFAEGRISVTGGLMKLFDGTGFLLHKTHARVITCYLRGANRIPWVRHRGWTRWFSPVSAHFSSPLEPPRLEHLGAAESRNRHTRWLRDQMVRQQFETEMARGPSTLPAAILETASRLPRKIVLEDVTRQELTYERLVAGARLLAEAGNWEPRRMGVLLPNLNATPVLLLSLWSRGAVPAVLNFSTGMSTMQACLRLAGLREVVTSRAFLERARMAPQAFTDAGVRLIYLEDLRQKIGGAARLMALLRVRFGRAPLGALPADPEAPAVILFTSGSEGVPKGVELSHRNLLANIRQMLSVNDMIDEERVFNALPLFHSFGLSVGTLLPLVRGLYTFLYPSPLHYRVVPTAFYDRDCTIFLSTNTFLNGYARKAQPYDFRSLRYLFAGAEKIQESTQSTWAQRFGVRILEGYGATECSPCVSLNTPLEPRQGTAGRLMPGMEYRLEPVEGVSRGGRLHVRGPNVMRGYLNPDANEKFKALGGWYDTGDIVEVDEAGYVRILGRLKRFAKVSGEMVSLTAVEEALAGAFPQYGLRCVVAVLTRPCDEKGEALVAVTNEARMTLEEVRAAVRARGLPNLAAPRELRHLREIPKLGTGKIDYRELQKRVEEETPAVQTA